MSHASLFTVRSAAENTSFAVNVFLAAFTAGCETREAFRWRVISLRGCRQSTRGNRFYYF